MSAGLSDERIMLKKKAAEFAQRRLNASVAERDRLCEFSRSGWEAAAEFGLQGMPAGAEYGGEGFSPGEIAAVLEGIGYGCLDNGLIFSLNAHLWGCLLPILKHGTKTQKGKYLPHLCSGRMIGAHAMTEPDTGSNAFGLKTAFRKDGSGYVINGSKTFVTNAPIADIFLVYARAQGTSSFAGISAFVIEKSTAGISVGSNIDKMGLRTSPMAQVYFNDCRVAEDSVLGPEGNGAFIFSESMEWERTFIMVNSLGITERLIRQCTEYAAARKIGKEPLSDYRQIQQMLAAMQARYDSSRDLIYKAIGLVGGANGAFAESAAAKLRASEAYVQTCRDAMQLYGGYGYMTEYGIERQFRDALASTIYSGTSQVLNNIIESGA